MSKTVILSNGFEFECFDSPYDHQARTTKLGDVIEIKFKHGDHTIEELLDIWNGNELITIKDNEDIYPIQKYTVCISIKYTPKYVVGKRYVCPECGASVESFATYCEKCEASFGLCKSEDILDKICTVQLSLPNESDRLSDLEATVENLIDSMLL